jgi:hypothetical protein
MNLSWVLLLASSTLVPLATVSANEGHSGDVSDVDALASDRAVDELTQLVAAQADDEAQEESAKPSADDAAGERVEAITQDDRPRREMRRGDRGARERPEGQVRRFREDRRRGPPRDFDRAMREGPREGRPGRVDRSGSEEPRDWRPDRARPQVGPRNFPMGRPPAANMQELRQLRNEIRELRSAIEALTRQLRRG